ncbi:cytoplasmic polyadenylation element-binding protein 1-like [Hypomesus transpacificus]|uniref:cytoplasmic polyadenylation element-binding protein 1-like n=1 Tax=Hypomesus transpacificus TaxID=137520 RepID=UPI001F07DF67|nr:cytoplasmic polyadenylation element-binding protein 1-like [Hypomesus transpacificus]
MLGNSLVPRGVCTSPFNERSTDHPLSELGDIGTSVMDNCLPSTRSRSYQDPSLALQSGLFTAAWLGMGLESLSLADWGSSRDPPSRTSPPSITKLGPHPGLNSLGPGGRAVVLGGSNSHTESCTLDTCFNSPPDSETSGFSSGSERLCDLLSTLQISHSVPLLKCGGQRDLSSSFQLEQDSLLHPLSPLPPELDQHLFSVGPPARRWPRAVGWPSRDQGPGGSAQRPLSIEAEAHLHRQCAALSDATLTWRGQLPPKNYRNAKYSCKVFLGGLPWDTTEARLNSTFSVFGHLSVEWPGKDLVNPHCPPKGYVYLMFEDERSVAALLKACSQSLLHPEDSQEYYFEMASRKMRIKKVQVIPWVLADSNYSVCPPQRLVPSRTVFVGGLHGMLNAQALALIMNDLFGGVIYVGIDTDRHKYPIGSGRVSFGTQSSYLKSLHAAFVEIKTPKFTKKVQIDPYVEDSVCQRCSRQPGSFFCRDMACFKYYCRTCWHWQHSMDVLCCHRPIMKNQKRGNFS